MRENKSFTTGDVGPKTFVHCLHYEHFWYPICIEFLISELICDMRPTCENFVGLNARLKSPLFIMHIWAAILKLRQHCLNFCSLTISINLSKLKIVLQKKSNHSTHFPNGGENAVALYIADRWPCMLNLCLDFLKFEFNPTAITLLI